jgi:hypothetical protein
MPRPADDQADLERQAAPDGHFRKSDEALLRRLARERRLARSAMAPTPGKTRPRGDTPSKRG